MPERKDDSQLADGRLVPNYVENLPLPIQTHRPANYAVVDMRTGQVWVADHEDPSLPKFATQEDLKLVSKLVRMS